MKRQNLEANSTASQKPKTHFIIPGNSPEEEPIVLPEFLTEKKDFEAAAVMYERFVAKEPKNAEHWRNLATMYGMSGQHEKAVGAFNQAVTIRPDYAEAWHCMGRLFSDVGQFALATLVLEKAAALDPKFTHTWSGLAQMYARLGRSDDAWNAWRKLKELDAEYAANVEMAVRELLETPSLN